MTAAVFGNIGEPGATRIERRRDADRPAVDQRVLEDTLDTRVIIRFDSLPATFLPTGDTARPITSVDSAYIQLRIDTLSIKGGGNGRGGRGEGGLHRVANGLEMDPVVGSDGGIERC